MGRKKNKKASAKKKSAKKKSAKKKSSSKKSNGGSGKASTKTLQLKPGASVACVDSKGNANYGCCVKGSKPGEVIVNVPKGHKVVVTDK